MTARASGGGRSRHYATFGLAPNSTRLPSPSLAFTCRTWRNSIHINPFLCFACFIVASANDILTVQHTRSQYSPVHNGILFHSFLLERLRLELHQKQLHFPCYQNAPRKEIERLMTEIFLEQSKDCSEWQMKHRHDCLELVLEITEQMIASPSQFLRPQLLPLYNLPKYMQPHLH